jgi:hypothetical protein
MKYEISNNGYVNSIKTNRNTIVNNVTVNGIRFRYNHIWKTYNSIVNNELLHVSSINLVELTNQVKQL